MTEQVCARARSEADLMRYKQVDGDTVHVPRQVVLQVRVNALLPHLPCTRRR